VIRNAIVGGILWAALAAGSILGLLRLELIEVLFLLGPLVVVPLGLQLSTRLGHGEESQLPVSFAGWIQLPSALCVAGSFWLPQGVGAALLALPWFCFGCFLGYCGLVRSVRGRSKNLEAVCVIVSFCYLPIGCAWLVASSYGLNPMGFQEPIVLLTAVHFHFAGFAAPLLARAAFAAVRKMAAPTQNIFKTVAAGVIAGPGMLAAGFVIGPRLKLAAALLLVASEIGLALFFLAAAQSMRPRVAQLLVTLSAASVLFAMVFAAVWAIGEFPLQPFVHLAQMAKFHGTANALGFTVCGLLGWTLSNHRVTDETVR
jgi:YndJ-like protein